MSVQTPPQNPMSVINPITFQYGMLTASNVPETDATAWNSATAYTVGQTCMYNHHVYQCLVNNTNKQPDTNNTDVAGTTAPWKVAWTKSLISWFW